MMGIEPFYLAEIQSVHLMKFDILFYQDEPLDTPNMALIWKLYKTMNKKE